MKELGRAVRARQGFWAEEDGPTVTQYAVLVVLIVFGVFATLAPIGAFLKSSFTNVSDGIPES